MAQSTVINPPFEATGQHLTPEVLTVLGDRTGRVDADVLAIGYALTGETLTLEEGGVLRRWDSATGMIVDTHVLSEAETCWSFSHHGRYLVSGSDGISIWNCETGELIGRHDDLFWANTITLSPDSRLIATGQDDFKVRIWDSQTGRLRHVLNGHHDEISAMAFSADGQRLATASEDRLVYIWDVATGDFVTKLEGHTDRVDDLAWSPSGHRIASAGWDTSVRIWDPRRAELLAMLNGQGECVHTVRFTPDGKWIVCGDSDGAVRLWDYQKLRIKAECEAHLGPVRKLALSPDGRQVVTGGGDRAIQFLNLRTMTPQIESTGARTTVVSLATSAGHRVAAVHGEGVCHLWDFATGKCQGPMLESERIISVAHDGRSQWALGTFTGDIAIVEGESAAEPVRKWTGHDSATKLLAFHPNGLELASTAAIDGTVKIWDSRTGEATLIIPEAARKATIEAMAYDPGDSVLAVAGIHWARGTAGVICLWNTQTIKLDRTLELGATAVAISPAGRFLSAVTLTNSIVIFDLVNGKTVKEIDGVDASTNAVLFSPDGEFFVTASDDAGIRSWDTAQWRMRASIDLQTRIQCLAYSTDGERLIAGNANSTCYVLDARQLTG